MKVKHIFLFVILTLAVLTTAAVCAAENVSLGFTQDIFMPVFLSYDGVSDDEALQYTPAENAGETAVLELSENTRLELSMVDGAPTPEVGQVKLVSRIHMQSLQERKKDFNHHVTACLRTAAALTGMDSEDDTELQNFLDEVFAAGYAEKGKLRGVYEEEMQGIRYQESFILMNTASEYTPSYDKKAYQAFEKLISSFKSTGVIPTDKTYKILNTDDFTDTWATMETPHWQSFTSAKNFALTAEVSWASAYELPNTASGGCGFVFRETGEDEHLMVSLRMDGNQYLTGKHNWNTLSYPSAFYDLPEISGTHQLTVVVNEEWIQVFLDDVFLNSYYGAAIMAEGGLGFATLAGTNYDFGTRCEFKNIFYTTW